MRRSIYIALGAIVLLLAITVAAVAFMPAERIGTYAAARASAALDRTIEVERFGIRLFPRPAVALENVRIGRSTLPDSTLASAERVELRPRLLPLFRRRIVIDEIALEKPFLSIDVTAGEAENLTAFPDTAGAAGSGAAELNIRRLRVNDGTVLYRDTANDTRVALSGITESLTLSGSIMDGAVSQVVAAGELSVGDIDIDAPGILAFPLHDLRLHVAHDVNVNGDADRLDLNQLVVTLQELTLDVTGSVTAMTDSLMRSVDLRGKTGSVDVSKLIASLPNALLASGSGDMLTGAD